VKPPLKKVSVVNAPVTASPFDEQIKVILEWASKHLSKVVCVANVHMVTEAYLNQDFGKVLKSADLVTPDGMPLVWMMRMLGARNQDRVAGLDILQAICKAAPSTNISLFFVGSETPILDQMRVRLNQEFPNLQIAEMEPLPFRPLTPAEDEALIQKINASGAGVVLVSLGCPKQERWMAEHKDKIHAVMIGLGGAFPVYAGICKRAPRWVREMGMEWFYRLIQEPRRLWKRYSTTIPLFLWLASKQLIKQPKVLLRSQS
jgi:N-acetylglucosaminyldiphosphoundecaprenol N-acetyl-beta-D-mannosaminyltransferase